MGLYLWSLAALSIHFLLLSSLPFVHPTHECHQHEGNALLQFKESFVISKFASYDPFSFPKTSSWIPSTDCCSWHGIQCDNLTGHVIGIDLSSSELYGSIDANSTLFSLVHLRSLDLSDNDFNGSQIPAKIGQFSQLRYLNLSQFSETTFFGEVPPEISQLSNLLSLDLRSYIESNILDDRVNHLSLNVSTLKSLAQNSTRLEQLRLNCVTISSSVPDILINLTSLQKLTLLHCGLYGEFPIEIFHLPSLQILNLGLNQNLRGMLPEFHSSGVISVLSLRDTSFYGTLPTSLGNLTSLNLFSITNCKFHGLVPSSLGNLNQLGYLDLSANSLKGQLELDIFLKLKMLTFLDLSDNKLSLLTGRKSSPNDTLPPIQILRLSSCNLSGEIPSWIMNLTALSYLTLENNNLHGEIPHSIFRLENLVALNLMSNFLEGQLELNTFLKLKMLTYLILSENKLSLFTEKVSSNATVPPFEVLGLASCKLVEFPLFLRELDDLQFLDLSDNDLKSIPSWIWRKQSLQTLQVVNGSLIGEISPLICNLKSLMNLDFSNNNLSGTIPSCFGNFSQSLQILALRGNKLVGNIPQTYMIGSALKLIDFSNNNLMGQLPRALINCRMLEFLDVSHNMIVDSFPYWLSTLPSLKVIALHHNEFHGPIMCPRRCTFPKLHIIDLSHNEFSGNLPPQIVKSWKAMTLSNTSQLEYNDTTLRYKGKGLSTSYSYGYHLTMSNKGVVMNYEVLQRLYYMVAVDLSSNRICGDVPNVMGDLKNLVFLNLSNNMFTGIIPSSLGKLSNLEALDLSLNRFSGKISQELTELTFLEFFNVSYNNLSGPVPDNKQFSTFQGNSFEGNQGLCGIQLLKKCEDHVKPVPPTSDDQDSDSDSGSIFEFGWKIVLIGYGGGLVAGLALGSAFSADFLQLLKRIF